MALFPPRRPYYVFPSYHHGFARSASESARPQDWQNLVRAWLPVIHPRGGGLLRELVANDHGTLQSMEIATDWQLDTEIGGTVLDFATDDYVDTNGNGFPALGNIFSFRFIAKFDDITTTDHFWGQSNTNNAAHFRQQSSGRFALIEPGTVISQTTDVVITQGAWHDFWFIKNGTGAGDNQIIVDGVDEALQNDGAFTLADTTATKQIGQRGDDTNFSTFTLAGLWIYNIVVPLAQIREMHNDPFGIVRQKRRQYIMAEQAAAAAGSLSFPQRRMTERALLVR